MEKVYHVGIDLHKSFSQVAVLDPKGKMVENRRLVNKPTLLKEYFGRFPVKTPVSLEATRG